MSILITCHRCAATRSDETGCEACYFERLSARFGEQGPTPDELRIDRLERGLLRAGAHIVDLEACIRGLAIALLFRTRGDA